MLRPRRYKELEKRLGCKFKSQDLLALALTHASHRGGKSTMEDNERLEFIGDRVLGLAMADILHKAHPKANEGELARRFNRLVRKEACARVGRDLVLGPHLIMSEGEAENGGRDKDTILADAVEAILGALYLDGGFDKARGVIMTLWEDHIGQTGRSVPDPKSALQEYAQGRGLALPQYVEIARKGPDHAPVFTTEVRIKGVAPALGEGVSKRASEQAAAAALLEREGVLEEVQNDT